MTDGRNVIPAGPGFVGPLDAPNEYSADVELELVYGTHGGSRGSLILLATNVEAPFRSMAMGVELTFEDLKWLRDTVDSMIVACIADDIDGDTER